MGTRAVMIEGPKSLGKFLHGDIVRYKTNETSITQLLSPAPSLDA